MGIQPRCIYENNFVNGRDYVQLRLIQARKELADKEIEKEYARSATARQVVHGNILSNMPNDHRTVMQGLQYNFDASMLLTSPNYKQVKQNPNLLPSINEATQALVPISESSVERSIALINQSVETAVVHLNENRSVASGGSTDKLFKDSRKPSANQNIKILL